ncbi:MAG TPA: hypothetical protein VFO20_09400 [Propionibacteriaceae bacterium]|nr:hypothetical protein [Propionibacteriaceae bacterium]
MMRRLIAGAAGFALTLGGVALAATPAQALTGAPCDDGDGWSWSIANPARYQAGPHEAVVGLSAAIRTVTIKAPTGCTVEAGDTWRVYNGYFSAEGTFNAEEAAAGKDTDRVSVEVPTSNGVAGDEIPVKLKVNDSTAGIPGVWDVDESNAGSLVLLRRTLFKYKGVTDRMNFADEPYICGEAVEGMAPLLRASWTSKRYLGYAGRTVRMEYRLTDGPDSAWANRFLFSDRTDDSGYVELIDFLGREEEGPGGVTADDGPPCGGTIVFRGHYGGNSTSSGTWSNGDAIAEAKIDWEKYRPHLKEEIDEAGAAKDCAKLEQLAQEVAPPDQRDPYLALWAYVFRWGVQTGCWEDD